MDFFRKYEKVNAFGSRSTVLHRQLLDRKIKSYFSSCLTLTTDMQGATLVNLDKADPRINAMEVTTPRVGYYKDEYEKYNKKKVFIVDVVNTSIIPEQIRKEAKQFFANIPRQFPLNPHPYRTLIGYAYHLLSQYAQECKVMITSRIHVGLPALALGIPVIFVKSPRGTLPGGHEKTGRVAGLTDLFHEIQLESEWTFGNTTSELLVPPNPGNHAADRYRASFWNRLKRNHFYRDSAKILGLVPFQRLGGSNLPDPTLQSTFHFILEAQDKNCWLTKRAIELVYYYHPNARVHVHSNSLPSGAFQIFTESGYNFVQLKLEHSAVSKDTVNSILSKYGGVFVSKNTFLLKGLSKTLGSSITLDADNQVAFATLRQTSDPSGARSLSTILMLSDEDTKKCFNDDSWKHSWDDANAVYFNPVALASMNATLLDSDCYKLLEEKCIYCDEVHVMYRGEERSNQENILP